jgi:hypothetical protein
MTLPAANTSTTWVNDKGITVWKDEAARAIFDALKGRNAYLPDDSGGAWAVFADGATIDTDLPPPKPFEQALELLVKSGTSSNVQVFLATDAISSLLPRVQAVFVAKSESDSKMVAESAKGPMFPRLIAEEKLGGGGLLDGVPNYVLVGGAVAALVAAWAIIR